MIEIISLKLMQRFQIY